MPSLRPALIKIAQSQAVVASEHGQRFLAHTLTLTQKLMSVSIMHSIAFFLKYYYIMNIFIFKDVHKTLMLELNSCNKKRAASYGKIYIIAWHGASEEMKPHLEKYCFQHLMEAFLKEKRTSLELTKQGHNIVTLLEVWHAERKKKHPQFITMITDSYQPFLWKYLKVTFLD